MKTVNIKGLEQIFEKNLGDDYLYKPISKIISYEISKTTRELDELKKELIVFEERFKMSSEDFFRKLHCGELNDSADFFEWSSLYQMYLRACERLTILNLK